MQLEDEAKAQFDDIVKDEKIVVLYKVNGDPVNIIGGYILWNLYSIWKKGFSKIIGAKGKFFKVKDFNLQNYTINVACHVVVWYLTWSCWRGRLVKLYLLGSPSGWIPLVVIASLLITRRPLSHSLTF